jgi:hypothetical protein
VLPNQCWCCASRHTQHVRRLISCCNRNIRKRRTNKRQSMPLCCNQEMTLHDSVGAVHETDQNTSFCWAALICATPATPVKLTADSLPQASQLGTAAGCTASNNSILTARAGSQVMHYARAAPISSTTAGCSFIGLEQACDTHTWAHISCRHE